MFKIFVEGQMIGVAKPNSTITIVNDNVMTTKGGGIQIKDNLSTKDPLAFAGFFQILLERKDHRVGLIFADEKEVSVIYLQKNKRETYSLTWDEWLGLV